MHWALGEAEMCRRANVLPFPTNRPEPTCAPAPSAGRVAQRDRMRGSTRVFEGQDITTITSPGFHSVNGNGNGSGNDQVYAPYPAVASSMSLPGIGNGQSFPGYDNGEDDDDESDAGNDQQQQQRGEGPRVRKRRLGNGTRLPSVAELDRTIAADLAASGEGRLVIKREELQQPPPSRRIKHEHGHGHGHGRRGSSGGSGASSRRSR